MLLCCCLAVTVQRCGEAVGAWTAPIQHQRLLHRAPSFNIIAHRIILTLQRTCRHATIGGQRIWARRVPDECCSVDAWPASVGFATDGPDARTIINDDSGKTVRCYARERVPAPGTYVRNFFGCYEGELMAAEGCAPTGTYMGHGYPLPSPESAIESSVDGDPVSCNCDKPWYNQGAGCYVALSGYITGVSPDPTANFLQVSGTCDN